MTFMYVGKAVYLNLLFLWVDSDSINTSWVVILCDLCKLIVLVIIVHLTLSVSAK